jgi:hypothetical protein
MVTIAQSTNGHYPNKLQNNYCLQHFQAHIIKTYGQQR